MDKFLEFLAEFNVQTILAMLAMLWWWSRDIKNEIKALEAKVDSQIAIQSARSDKLYEMFVSLQKETKDAITVLQKETKDMFIEILKENKKT